MSTIDHRRTMRAARLLLALAGMCSVAGGATADYHRPLAQQFDLPSADGQRTYRIFLAAPATAAPAGGYPVIYAMDGNDSFGTVADTARRLAFESEQTGYDAAIVVAIGYPMQAPYDEVRRTFDLTPPASRDLLPAWDADRSEWPATGGADQMLDFIEQQVRPAVAARLPIDRARETLMGHSFGGLFTLHALFTRPRAFDAYVAISPSIWYAKRHILGEAAAFADRLRARPQRTRLLVIVGACEQDVDQCDTGMPRNGAREQFLTYARQVDNARDLQAALGPLAGLGLQARLTVLAGEQHTTVVPAAIGRAVRFALRDLP